MGHVVSSSASLNYELTLVCANVYVCVSVYVHVGLAMTASLSVAHTLAHTAVIKAQMTPYLPYDT